jgi:hypothetical protein
MLFDQQADRSLKHPSPAPHASLSPSAQHR